MKAKIPDSSVTVRHNRVGIAVGETIAATFATDGPWYTSNAKAWLEQHIPSSWTGLEYGGGRSTIWWAKRLKTLHCVEASTRWLLAILSEALKQPEVLLSLRLHLVNADWRYFDDGSLKLRDHWPDNADLLNAETVRVLEHDYVSPPTKHADIVMIDGAIREKTASYVVRHHADLGASIVVIDNTERISMASAARRLENQGFLRLDFEEYDPTLVQDDRDTLCTTVLVRSDLGPDFGL